MGFDPLGGIFIPDMSAIPAAATDIARSITELARRAIHPYADAAARDAAATTAGLTAAQRKGRIDFLDDSDRWYGTDDGTTFFEIGGKRQRVWTAGRGATDNYNHTGPLTFISLWTLVVPNAPAGDYAITATMALGSTTANAGTIRMNANGTNVCGDLPCDLSTIRIPVGLSGGYQLATAGTLTIEVLQQPTGSTNTIYVGSRITAAWLGPR